MIGTENLEEKLSQVLNDPNSMAQLMSFAQSLGMGPPDAPRPPVRRPGRHPVRRPATTPSCAASCSSSGRRIRRTGRRRHCLRRSSPICGRSGGKSLTGDAHRAHLADRRRRAEAARRPAGRAERCITVIPQRPAGNTNASPSRSRSVRPAHRRGSRRERRVPLLRRLRRSRRDRRRVLPRRPVRRAHRCGCRFWRG